MCTLKEQFHAVNEFHNSESIANIGIGFGVGVAEVGGGVSFVIVRREKCDVKSRKASVVHKRRKG